MTAITFSEGYMSETKETGKFNPEMARTAAVLLAVILGSGGVTTWNQSGLLDLLQDYREEQETVIEILREDVESLREQVVGSHNLQDILRIQRAIEGIDPDNSDLWTGNGKPRIAAIHVVLREHGYPYLRVNTSLRDMAWGLSGMAR